MAFKPGGQIANQHGARFEQIIADTLLHKGYREVSAEERKTISRAATMPMGNCFVRQASPYRNLYGSKFKLDFMISSDEHPNGLIIEVKFQGSAGSVDEKYVFTVESLIKLPGHKVMLMAGTGARACAIEWIKSRQNKSFEFYTFDSFLPWMESNL